jgi:hypothetical protein
MQDVEIQVGNAAAQWESRGPATRLPRSEDHLPSLLAFPTSSSPSSTGRRNSSASDMSATIGINVVGPEEDDPHRMQEFYPCPSPITPDQSVSHSNEALVNRLDGVSH